MSWTENRTVRWSAGAGLLCLLIVIATWFVLISPRRAQAAEVSAQDVAAQESNDVLRTRIEELRVQYGKLADARAKLAEIRTQLPSTSELPTLVRSVDSLATSSGVDLVSLSPGAAQAVSATTAVAGQTGQTGQTAATGEAAGLVSIPVAIVVSGDYFEAVAFLRKLQTDMPRAFLIVGLQITLGQTSSDASTVQVSVSGQIFSRPETSTTTGTAGTAGTAATSTAPATVPTTSVAGATPTTGSTAGTATPSPGATGSVATATSSSASALALRAPVAGPTSGSPRW